MARCWTCGKLTSEPVYKCSTCHTMEQLKNLRKENVTSLNALAEIQRQGFEELSNALSEIASIIEWGFEEVIWQLYQQTDILRSIDHTLKTPSQTQANEWRQMAEELRGRGVLDKAEEFFVKSIDNNPLDYRTYIGLVQTYLQMNKFDKAKEHLEESIPHAPDSKSKAYSYRLIGHVYACYEDYPNAISTIQSAVELSPNYYEATYDLAQYNAQIKNKGLCLTSLRYAIKGDSFYFYLTQKERNFESLRSEVKNLLEEINTDAYNKAKESISRAEEMLKFAEESVAKAQEVLWRCVDKNWILVQALTLLKMQDQNLISQRIRQILVITKLF